MVRCNSFCPTDFLFWSALKRDSEEYEKKRQAQILLESHHTVKTVKLGSEGHEIDRIPQKVIESEHPYPHNEEMHREHVFEGALRLYITFDPQCDTEYVDELRISADDKGQHQVYSRPAVRNFAKCFS